MGNKKIKNQGYAKNNEKRLSTICCTPTSFIYRTLSADSPPKTNVASIKTSATDTNIILCQYNTIGYEQDDS